MISINSTGLVSRWIENYKIWRDYKIFYSKHEHLEILHSDTGIPCYHYTDIDQINKEMSPIIVIDCLTEGIHSLNFFKKYDCNKHYLIFSNGWWDTTTFQLPISYDLIHYYFFLIFNTIAVSRWFVNIITNARTCFYKRHFMCFYIIIHFVIFFLNQLLICCYKLIF